jgi:hypothetical protein
VLGTQETFYIVIAGLLERDSFDLFLPEFDEPWVIHLRETCCCSINLYTWRPNTVYKNRSVCRHLAISFHGNMHYIEDAIDFSLVDLNVARLIVFVLDVVFFQNGVSPASASKRCIRLFY